MDDSVRVVSCPVAPPVIRWASHDRNAPMDDGWVELTVAEAMNAIGAPRADGAVSQAAFELLLGQPVSREWLRTETTWPKLPPGVMGHLVPRTRIFVNKARAKELRGDVYATASVYCFTQSLTAASAVSLFRKIANSVKMLTEDEVDLLLVVLGTSSKKPPVRPASLADVQAAYDGEGGDLRARLSALTARGVLVADSGGWFVAD